MTLLEGGLILFGQRADGGGNSYVAFKLAQLELEVTAGEILAGDFNALDGNEHSLLCGKLGVLEGGSLGVSVGEVHGGHCGLVGVNNFNDTVHYLVCAAVCVSCAGNANGHSDLKVALGYGVGGHIVGIVASVAVLHIDAVGAVALGFCHYCGDNTLANDCAVISRGNVLSPAQLLEGGNLVVEGDLGGLAVGVLDGSLENIDYFLGSLFVNIDRDSLAGIVGDYLYAVGRAGGYLGGPFNGVAYAVYAQHAYALKVGGSSLRLVLVHSIEEILCRGKSVLCLCG